MQNKGGSYQFGLGSYAATIIAGNNNVWWKLLLLFVVWDYQQQDFGAMASHRPRGPMFQTDMNPKIFSTFYPKFWNMDYGKSQSRPQKIHPHNASLYFNPFKFPDSISSNNNNNNNFVNSNGFRGSEEYNNGGSSGGLSSLSSNRVLTPYIGARALSNMEKFFEDLQENVEILKDEYNRGGGGSSSSSSGVEPAESAMGMSSNNNPVTSAALKSAPPLDKSEMMMMQMPDSSQHSHETPYVSSGRQRWLNPAASFFRGKHRLTPRNIIYV